MFAALPLPRVRWCLLIALSVFFISCSSGQNQEGIIYTHDPVEKVPWSIHVLKIDRSHHEFSLQTTLSNEKVLGLSKLSEQIRALPASLGKPIAAINGDFYVVDRGPYIGDPRGLQILNGEMVSSPSDQASFWLDPAGNPQATNVTSELKVTFANGKTYPLGLNEERPYDGVVLYTPTMGASTFTSGGVELVLTNAGGSANWLPFRPGHIYKAAVQESRGGNTPLQAGKMVLSLSPTVAQAILETDQIKPGAVLTISAETFPDLKGVEMAISGGSILIRDGKKVPLPRANSSAYKFRSVHERHPRTAIGANSQYIFFVQVDGRQPGHSVGMTLAELADYMLKIGCELAMNLDGGASSSLLLNGKVMNSPCNGGLRDIANGLVLLQKPKSPEPVRSSKL